MITPNYYLAWLDMKDAFYPVLIYEQHKKYLRFLNTGIAYQFEVMPNGYLDAMRVFTKILKPPFSCLREQNHSSVIYVDDSLLAGNACKDCLDNIHDTKLLLEGLGFYIHQEKSVFSPTQLIIFLAFTFYDKISDQSKKKKSNSTLTIRQVARILGNIAASFDAVSYGCLHYRYLEQNKIMALRKVRGNFESPCIVTPEASSDIIW